ncbi:MAG: hypothetical protein WD036_06720, partial [Bauldia sp.]
SLVKHRPTPSTFPSREEVLAFIGESPGKVGKREIARAFNLRGQDKIPLKRLLTELKAEGLLGSGKGKRGGIRVIYYVVDADMPLHALLVYGKNERDDLTADEKKAIRAFAFAIKATRKRR